ncbi:hypothetical protein SUGI_1072310 [Cryptomeria japonica]|uniref:probable calcium-binding protein CML44 n=1 Tax=Cryptomeria japonica TaxID=3369 RepID=UPI002414C66C|nr:probable calcium-binding protein CML44 [Cryptomeria japonica]GLJ50336.1 hypothetical protein SUGI_1072310 [Cryptomeria japonica]
MVSDNIRNSVVFYASLFSLCWQNIVSLALTFLQRFCCAFAIQIFKTGIFSFSSGEGLKFIPDEPSPTCASIIDEVGDTSESEKLLQNIKKWDLARIFHVLDSNRDGMVSTDDIQGLLQKLGLQYYCDDGLKIMTNFPEHLSFDEFCRVCVSLVEDFECAEGVKQVSEKEELKEAFCVFDKNDDGFITPPELQNALLNLGFREANELENCDAMIAKFDRNCDGKIDFEEFENMMTIVN